MGFRMLNESTNLKPIVYSLMLYEKSKAGNLLRIQTDNFDQPLDINEGIRIDLGSTSKFRTMVHYLELVTEVYQQHKGFSSQVLSKIEIHPKDDLTQWVIAQLIKSPKVGLEELLNNALDKTYSANPGEYFFTGGGLHHFSNFTADEDSKIMSIRDALRDSVNLVFIRMMREIVYHHLYKPDGIARWLDSEDSPKRQEYLQKFADNEGQEFLHRFYSRYEGKTPVEALDMLTKRVFPKASRFTMLFRVVNPEADEMALSAFLAKHLDKAELASDDVYDLYDKYSIEKFDLQDQGYITKIHPLELWLVGYLTKHPEATYKEIVAASTEPRQQVYRWLFKNNRHAAQQQRIMTLLEEEAFNKIHAAWKRVGYPFEELTPSYATSIGASGDRPAALADLMGIVVNDGIKMPDVRFETLHYAEGTPYETILKKSVDQGERIFAPEIAKAARGALVGVVTGGTAIRLNNVYANIDGVPLSVGGKTGTGDHRKQTMSANGEVIESKFISRAATFTFFIGERYFGVITAYVEGDNAGQYHFTSSLPVQIVKFLKPVLSPLINNTIPVKLNNPLDKNSGNISVISTSLNVEPASKIESPIAAEKPVNKVVAPVISPATVKPTQQSPLNAPLTSVQKLPVIPPVNRVNTVVVSKQAPNSVQTIPKPLPSTVVQPPKLGQPPVVKPTVTVVSPILPQKPDIKLVPKISTPSVVNKQSGTVSTFTPVLNQPKVVVKPTVSAPTKPSTTAPASTPKNDGATRYYHYPTVPSTTLPNTAR